MAKPVYGRCRVCGTYGKLSEEHVPPKRAFNNMPYVELSFDQKLSLGPETVPTGPKRQGGIRFHTLCKTCNNDFGGWYARAFIEWCYEGMFILERSGGNPNLVYAHHVFPLRIIKEIVAMFFSVNGDNFRNTPTGQELVWLLRNKEEKGLPPGVRIYVYFNHTGQVRYNSIAALMNMEKNLTHVFAEITYPPYGYVMALDSEPPDRRLFDITHFAFYDYFDARAIFLDLPVLPTHLGIWGDYRPLDEIHRQSEANRKLEERQNLGLPTNIHLAESLDPERMIETIGRALKRF